MPKREKEEDEDSIVSLADLEVPVADDDVTSAGHILLRQQRQVLYYMRLIDHDMPNLVGAYTHRVGFTCTNRRTHVQRTVDLSSRPHHQPLSLFVPYHTAARSTLRTGSGLWLHPCPGYL